MKNILMAAWALTIVGSLGAEVAAQTADNRQQDAQSRVLQERMRQMDEFKRQQQARQRQEAERIAKQFRGHSNGIEYNNGRTRVNVTPNGFSISTGSN